MQRTALANRKRRQLETPGLIDQLTQESERMTCTVAQALYELVLAVEGRWSKKPAPR